MIDKQAFYHGAALMRVVEDNRCQSIVKSELGFIVNSSVFVYLKYTTKGRTPWRFQFADEEVHYLNSATERWSKVVIAFVCGGDGICGMPWQQVSSLIGNTAGWISCKRNFNEQYAVAGSQGKIKGKVGLRQWPTLIFLN